MSEQERHSDRTHSASTQSMTTTTDNTEAQTTVDSNFPELTATNRQSEEPPNEASTSARVSVRKSMGIRSVMSGMGCAEDRHGREPSATFTEAWERYRNEAESGLGGWCLTPVSESTSAT